LITQSTRIRRSSLLPYLKCAWTGWTRCWHIEPKLPDSGRANLWLGILLIALAALSWSTAGLFPRIVSTDVFTTLFWRSFLGGASVLLAQALFNKGRNLPGLWRLTWPELWMSLASSGAMICFIAAFFFTMVADVVFIYSAFPILTLLLSALLLRTAIHRIDVLCTLTVILGMCLIVWGQTSLHNLLGAALSLMATLLFALITIGIKRFPQADMVKVTYVGAFIAALAMVPFSNFRNTSAHDLVWLWLYGFLNVAVGFGLYLLGVRRIKAVLASLVCMIEIPLAPLWVYVLFGEQVSQRSLLGGGVIVMAALANVVFHGH
jgi:drug/metabolite transporter (DMT)-like permease